MPTSIAVVLPAAGEGRRLGGAEKPFLELGGRPVVFWALEPFRNWPGGAEVVLAVRPERVAALEAEWGERLRAAGVSRIVAGGRRRQDSVLAGLRAVSGRPEVAVVHDAARPFLSDADVRRVVAAAARVGAAILAAPVRETVKEADAAGRILRTVPRGPLHLAQTPQAARFDVLLAALSRAEREGFDVTDEAEAVEQAGGAVELVPGAPWNIKITTPADLRLAEAIARMARG